MWETQVQSLGREDPLEKEMAIHSSSLAWKVPRTEEPCRPQCMGLQRVGHDWATSLHFTSVVKNQPGKQETQVQSLGWEDPLEKEMATCSSILAWDVLAMDRGASQAAVHRIAKSKRWLNYWTHTEVVKGEQKISYFDCVHTTWLCGICSRQMFEDDFFFFFVEHFIGYLEVLLHFWMSLTWNILKLCFFI